MFILKKGHQPGVYVPLRALFLVRLALTVFKLIKKENFVLPGCKRVSFTPG